MSLSDEERARRNRECKARWARENKDRMRQTTERWRKKNPSKVEAYRISYRDRANELQRKRRRSCPEKEQEYRRRYRPRVNRWARNDRLKHPEKYRAKAKAWEDANRERIRLLKRNHAVKERMSSAIGRELTCADKPLLEAKLALLSVLREFRAVKRIEPERDAP